MRVPRINKVQIKVEFADDQQPMQLARVSIDGGLLQRIINPRLEHTATFHGLAAGKRAIVVSIDGQMVGRGEVEVSETGDTKLSVYAEDSTGGGVIGVRRQDIKKTCEDLRQIFAGERFSGLRDSISFKKKKINRIEDAKREEILANSDLSPDDKVLLEIVMSTINDPLNSYYVEYRNLAEAVSTKVQKGLGGLLSREWIAAIAKDGVLHAYAFQGSVTGPYKTGSMSLIVADRQPAGDYYDSKVGHYVTAPLGRPALTAHEIFGHGRSLANGRVGAVCNADSIRFENLLLRCVGHQNIQRDGTDHADHIKLDNYSAMPEYR